MRLMFLNPDVLAHARQARYIAACEAHESELKSLFSELESAGRELEGQVSKGGI